MATEWQIRKGYKGIQPLISNGIWREQWDRTATNKEQIIASVATQFGADNQTEANYLLQIIEHLNKYPGNGYNSPGNLSGGPFYSTIEKPGTMVDSSGRIVYEPHNLFGNEYHTQNFKDIKEFPSAILTDTNRDPLTSFWICNDGSTQNTMLNVTTEAAIAPDGSNTANRIEIANATTSTRTIITNRRGFQQQDWYNKGRMLTAGNKSILTWSIFAKAGELNKLVLEVREGGFFNTNRNLTASFNLDTGVASINEGDTNLEPFSEGRTTSDLISIGSIIDATMTPVSGYAGWYKCSLKFQVGAINGYATSDTGSGGDYYTELTPLPDLTTDPPVGGVGGSNEYGFELIMGFYKDTFTLPTQYHTNLFGGHSNEPYVSADNTWSPISSGINDGDGLYLWGAHLHYSDIPMVSTVEAVDDTYYRQYKPVSLGHHIFDGTTWNNEGAYINSITAYPQGGGYGQGQFYTSVNWFNWSNHFNINMSITPDAGTEARIQKYDVWEAPVNATLTANSTISPDGTLNAWKFVPDNLSTSAHLTQHEDGGTSTEKMNRPSGMYMGEQRSLVMIHSEHCWTMSIFAKAGELTVLTMEFGNTYDGVGRVSFDLEEGKIISTSNMSGSFYDNAVIENYDNGWYRCSITKEWNAGSPHIWGLTCNPVKSLEIGDGTSGFYIYGAQLTSTPWILNYIPTTSNPGIRQADILSISLDPNNPRSLMSEVPWFTPKYVSPKTNIVTNSDFSDGTNEWSGNSADGVGTSTIQSTSGGITITCNDSIPGSHQHEGFLHQDYTFEEDAVYEIKVKVSSVPSPGFRLFNTSCGSHDLMTPSAENNTTYTSIIRTLNSTNIAEGFTDYGIEIKVLAPEIECQALLSSSLGLGWATKYYRGRGFITNYDSVAGTITVDLKKWTHNNVGIGTSQPAGAWIMCYADTATYDPVLIPGTSSSASVVRINENWGPQTITIQNDKDYGFDSHINTNTIEIESIEVHKIIPETAGHTFLIEGNIQYQETHTDTDVALLNWEFDTFCKVRHHINSSVCGWPNHRLSSGYWDPSVGEYFAEPGRIVEADPQNPPDGVIPPWNMWWQWGDDLYQTYGKPTTGNEGYQVINNTLYLDSNNGWYMWSLGNDTENYAHWIRGMSEAVDANTSFYEGGKLSLYQRDKLSSDHNMRFNANANNSWGEVTSTTGALRKSPGMQPFKYVASVYSKGQTGALNGTLMTDVARDTDTSIKSILKHAKIDLLSIDSYRGSTWSSRDEFLLAPTITNFCHPTYFYNPWNNRNNEWSDVHYPSGGFLGTIKRFRMWSRKLPDEIMESLTVIPEFPTADPIYDGGSSTSPTTLIFDGELSSSLFTETIDGGNSSGS